MDLAPCRAMHLALNPTIAGASPHTSVFCNSVRTRKSRTCRPTGGRNWKGRHDSHGIADRADRTMAAKLAPGGHWRIAAGDRGAAARPRPVPPLLSFCLSLLDRHGARMPGHLTHAPCGRREMGHAD